MDRYRVNAIVLRRFNYGEADRVVRVITDTKGKITLMARGVRKQRSKLAGGIEPLALNELSGLPGRGEMDQLVGARAVRPFTELLGDYERLQTAFSFTDLIDKNTEDDAESAYFELLNDGYEELSQSTPLPLVRSWFLMQLLKLSGHSPNLRYDVHGQLLSDGARYNFDVDLGGLEQRDNGTISSDVIKAWRLLANGRPSDWTQVRGLLQASQESLSVLDEVAQFHLRS